MTLTIILWIIGIHVLEITAILFYVLIKKNKKMEQIVINQQNKIDNIQNIINNGIERISEADSKGTFRSDDELGTFWSEITSIYQQLHNS